VERPEENNVPGLLARRYNFMNENKSGFSYYEVLSPWGEVDPAPLQGISPRLSDLKNKTIGLFVNEKRAAAPMQTAVEAKLKEKFPSARFSRYVFSGGNREVAGTEYESGYADWIKSVDAIVSAVGD
jgi:hypothetical protein